MRDSWNAVKVGLLVVIALVAGYLVYRLVDERSGGTRGYGVWAVFDDAQGLVPKSRVLIAGIQVGYIEKIRLWGTKARVDIHIEEGVTIREDAWVSKRTASILGESILVINPGHAPRRVVGEGARVRTLEDTPTTDQILTNVGRIAESVRRITDQIDRTFGTDEGGRQMASALRNLTEALEGINRTIQANETVINNTLRNVEGITADTAPRLAQILENVEIATRDVRHILDDNREGLTHGAGEVGDTVSSIHRASEQLEQVLGDVREVTDRTARGEGTIGRLTSDEHLIDEVQGVAEGVNDIVGPISRLQTIVELRSEYNFLANTFKSYVGLRLQPREDRYYLIQLINDPRGLTEFTQTTVHTSPPLDGVPQTYQETRVTTRDAFRFSLLFAKRVGPVTFRYGLIESTGGVGADLHMFDDRFEMNADVFAFGEQQFPRLRLRAALEVLQRLWILGGVDDMLNETSSNGGRDFFLGAQLRFNDEDLKSILPFAGGLASSGSSGN